VLLRFARAPGIDEQAQERRVRITAQRVDLDERARIRQRVARRAIETRDHRAHDPRTGEARLLALGGAPRLELVEVGEIETLQELAAELRGQRAQRLGGRLVDAVGEGATHVEDVHRDLRRIQLHGARVGEEAHAIWPVHERPQLAQAPPQRAARIVGHVPQERAEALARVPASGQREVGEQRPRLLGRRKGDALRAADELDLSQHAKP
jgi:hypothetical protein